MRSLRFRLPALLLAGVLVAGIVMAVIAVGLFQDASERQTVGDLRRQARELASLVAGVSVQGVDAGTAPPTIAAPRLEGATGTRLYYVGLSLFPGSSVTGLRSATAAQLGIDPFAPEQQTFEFTPADEQRPYIAIAQPVRLGGETFGALVVAKPKAELGQSWAALAGRFGLAFLGGLLVAGALFVYLSRRLTRPVLALSRAAEAVARGRYDVAVPELRSGDEVAHLADRFRDMTRRLAEADELERNFLMTVSHELRTPLTAIRGHVDALREGLAEDPGTREQSLEVIRVEAERLSRLVGDLLDLAKLDANRFTLLEEEVDLGRLLEQAYQGFAEEARRREIRFERSIDGAPLLHTDGDRVLQVVSNLLANAFDWTPNGGEVDLALDARNGRVAVSVTDTGPGIPPEERERIFRPFWSRNGHGTGLGLAIARELAGALGGRLELETQPGQGSRFSLVLPRS
jgi:signal transduction histidine kinase